MSLQVWLPLDGDLHNQGLSNIQFINNGATVDTNGKIGKCYSFNGSSNTIYNRNVSINCNKLSICCWIYRNSSSSAEGYIASLNNGSGYIDTAIGLDSSNATTIVFVGGGNSTLRTTITSDTWIHVAVTYDGQNVKGYINGQKIGEQANTTILNKSQLAIGCRCDSTNSFKYYFPGKINDFRLYDHALSDKEVKEIAKGLVLHYKLDNNGLGNPNLINNFDTSFISYSDGPSTLFINQMNGGTQEIISNFNGAIKCLHLHNLGGNGRQYRTLAIQAGKTYTISADYYSDNAQGTAWRGELNGGNYSWLGANAPYTTPGQWQRLSYTYNNLTSDATIIFFIYCAKGQDCYVKNIKIEEGLTTTPWNSGDWFNNKIYDSSGYQYNGTIIESLFYSNDTARYSSATIFDGNTSGILIKNLPLSDIINTAVTYSFWIKPQSENGARSVYFSSYSSISWSIEKTTGNKLRLYWNGSPDETTSAIIKDGEWQHIAITKNGTNDIKVYLNGEWVWTSAAAHNNLTFPTTYRIGRDTRSGDGTPYHGLMSDFRIYATALSADDIKELYNTSASIDNKGNVYAREVVEI